MHFLFALESQIELTGMHCNVIAKKNATVWQAIHNMQILVTRRNRGFVKTRRNIRRIETFARSRTTT
jgi:hypothetical protein